MPPLIVLKMRRTWVLTKQLLATCQGSRRLPRKQSGNHGGTLAVAAVSTGCPVLLGRLAAVPLGHICNHAVPMFEVAIVTTYKRGQGEA